MTVQNKENAKEFLKTLDRSPDHLDAFLADDAEYHVIGRLLKIGPFLGKKAISGQFVPMVKQLFPRGLNITIDNVIAEGNHVAVECHSDTEAANGNRYANVYHFLFEFRDGKICKVKEYSDSHYAKETLMPG
jgi:ketosteroid isomerase-like protein